MNEDEAFKRSREFVLEAIREVGIRARHFSPRNGEGEWAARGSVAPRDLDCVRKLTEGAK